jgi:hypothetical protein
VTDCVTDETQTVQGCDGCDGFFDFSEKWEQCQDLIRLTLSGNLMSPNFKYASVVKERNASEH